MILIDDHTLATFEVNDQEKSITLLTSPTISQYKRKLSRLKKIQLSAALNLVAKDLEQTQRK